MYSKAVLLGCIAASTTLFFGCKDEKQNGGPDNENPGNQNPNPGNKNHKPATQNHPAGNQNQQQNDVVVQPDNPVAARGTIMQN